MNRQIFAVGCIGIMFICVIVFFGATPTGTALWNSWWHDVDKAAVNSSYISRKTTEDTARAMLASYRADILAWQQNITSDSKDMRSVALQAQLRANQTAASFNEYMRKNSYVWRSNIPHDLPLELPYLNNED